MCTNQSKTHIPNWSPFTVRKSAAAFHLRTHAIKYTRNWTRAGQAKSNPELCYKYFKVSLSHNSVLVDVDENIGTQV